MEEEFLVQKNSEHDIVNERHDTVDRISQLPGHIIHHILSFLHIKDTVRTSMLSKTWHHVWSSFPISDFDGNLFAQRMQRKVLSVRNNEFMNFVNDSLLRLRKKQISSDKFKFAMVHYNIEFASHIDQWMEYLSTRSNIRILDLCIRAQEKNTWYSLPKNTLMMMGMSLVVLKLTGCRIEKAAFSNSTEFISLQELSLDDVYIDDNLTQKLIASCPSIKSFALIRCSGVKNLHISCLPKLEKVELHQTSVDDKANIIGSITINAPALQILFYRGEWKECNIDATSCKNLKELNLQLLEIDEAWFHNFVSQFPLLNALTFCSSVPLKRINISSHQLKSLRFGYLLDLEEVQIDCPNLHLFLYAGHRLPRSISIDISSLHKAKIVYSICDHELCNSWLLDLRNFLPKFGSNTILRLIIYIPMVKWILEELADVSVPPPKVNHLELELTEDFERPHDGVSPKYYNIVDGLLWSLYPKTLSIVLGARTPFNYTFIRCLCETLINKGNNPNCCNSSCLKCWRHHLKDYQISQINDGKIFHCKTLLESLPTREYVWDNRHSLIDQEIRFNFQW